MTLSITKNTVLSFELGNLTHNSVCEVPVDELDQSEVTNPPCVVASQLQLTVSLDHYTQGLSLKPEKVDIIDIIEIIAI